MLAKLTLKLAAVPEEGWPRFAAAHARAERLPSPLRHAASVGAVSAVSTAIGAGLRSQATASGTVLQLLLGVVAYVGGAALAIELSARLIAPHRLGASEAARFASGAVLPVAASGVMNWIPLIPLNFVLALAGAALSIWSGWIGASAMLGLEGPLRKRAAAVPAGLALGVVLLATIIRMGLPK